MNEVTRVRNENEKLDVCRFMFDRIRNLLEGNEWKGIIIIF